ncbi:MAG TPA: valine--tRNA ligase, partial [Tepidisphaeraceae bacterium]|nr:valine--tRNA ligase [Tepidisphaeraceae bacterium]
MSTDLPKTYDPAVIEPQAYDVWIKERAFHADPTAPGKPYSIVIPPPNVTGALHLGHAINNTLQDILTRVHRMMGDNTVWIPGIDHAGIATQAVVERTIKEQEGKDRYSLAPSREESRNELIRRIWQWKEQYGNRIVDQLKKLGCSCDWDRTRFTLDEMCARAVRETFFKLFKDGLIYRGKRLVNWDIHLQTSISDDEIYHETVKTNLWHIKYPIVDVQAGSGQQAAGSKESGLPAASRQLPAEFMVVATTRPETMLGDTAVAVHSEDPRWNWAIGKSVKLPLTGRLVPIIADDILVDPKFGTGVVKVTPAHDPNDYAVWQRHQGKPDQIDLINILNPDGTLNENAGAYKGMKRDAARKKVVEDLGELLLKEEPYETQVGHSDRSKTAVEPYLSDQWFVKMAPLAEPALEVVRNGTIKFFPERHAQQYLSWLGEKRDWPISRQLWWGHRIPVWSRMQGYSGMEEAKKYGQTLGQIHRWQNEGRSQIIEFNKTSTHSQSPNGMPIHTTTIDRLVDPKTYVCVREDDREVIAFLEANGFIQDPDVLDTWFSSALWPHSTLGWPEQTDALAKWYPTSVLLTGRDIITLWVARMVMTGMYNMGDRAGSGQQAAGSKNSGLPAASRQPPASLGIPFAHVAINPTILDGKGERMSKSKGNGVDPVEIIETHGADALRFTLTHMATETQDVRLPVKKLPNGKNTSEKFDLGRNFCNKLWNAARFVLGSLATENTEKKNQINSSVSSVNSVALSLADKWIISRFNATVKEIDDALAVYRFDQYARAVYQFFWNDFCDWYVEASKSAMKDPARATQTAQVLAAVLDGALRLLHPIIPFITETIWWRLNEVRPRRGIAGQIDCPPSPRLIKAAWPQARPIDEAAEHVFPRLQDVIS